MTKDTRDRREYHRALRAIPGYQEMQRAKRAAKLVDPAYAEKERERERLRSIKRRAHSAAQINELARSRHTERMAQDTAYRRAKADNSYKWMKGNPVKRSEASIRRYAKQLQAVPVWADREQIMSVYRLAAERRASGIDCEVDHIVPLLSPHVCGLHVAHNLQLLGSRDNKAKGNRDWPGR